MRIKPIFAWHDLWVGAYWDRDSLKLYFLPLPCIGLVFEFESKFDKWKLEIEAERAAKDKEWEQTKENIRTYLRSQKL